MDSHVTKEYNSKAIASMTVGILSLIIPYLGIILGIVGIFLSKKAFSEINYKNQQGKGLAITGLTTSIVSISIYTVILFFMILFALFTI